MCHKYVSFKRRNHGLIDHGRILRPQICPFVASLIRWLTILSIYSFIQALFELHNIQFCGVFQRLPQCYFFLSLGHFLHCLSKGHDHIVYLKAMITQSIFRPWYTSFIFYLPWCTLSIFRLLCNFSTFRSFCILYLQAMVYNVFLYAMLCIVYITLAIFKPWWCTVIYFQAMTCRVYLQANHKINHKNAQLINHNMFFGFQSTDVS